MAIQTPHRAGHEPDWTTPPERVVGHLEEIGKMWAQLPEVLPKIVSDPGAFVEADEPLGAIARRLVSIPTVAPPEPNADGDSEQLGDVTVTHRFADAPGDSETVRWHYVEAGPADADPVVFLHGVPDSWFQWSLAVAELGREHRCLCIDLKGYGQSDKRTGDYRQEGVAEQLIALLDEIGIGSFSLVTHDRGTPPADHLVAKLGDRVTRYARGQQHLWHLHPLLHPQEKMFTAPTAPFVLGDARTMVIVGYTALSTKPVSDALLERTIAEFSYEGIASAVPRYFNSSSFRQEFVDRRTRLIDAWKCPVLLVQGKDDPGQPHEFYTDPDVLARLPKGSDVHLLDAGHFWPFEAPQEMNEVLSQFLRS